MYFKMIALKKTINSYVKKDKDGENLTIFLSIFPRQKISRY
ncbi:hypothetical protein CWATWH0402_418 [Crocosphaera watsonii WH 0402]|uniref:Uncharacterized protein n=1 Tax=Crocosphaera watsonii WH 0402 TaxID=1284629 RepID=T2JVJ6_CROWT|nr:hypothetical protein CWATWH0402_418 [Crocosphaera watsonii WH 0402]